MHDFFDKSELFNYFLSVTDNNVWALLPPPAVGGRQEVGHFELGQGFAGEGVDLDLQSILSPPNIYCIIVFLSPIIFCLLCNRYVPRKDRTDFQSGRRMTLQKGGIPEPLAEVANWTLGLVKEAIPSRPWQLNGGTVLAASDVGDQH